MAIRTNFRKGVCAVVFRKTESEPLFLILHRVQNWSGWELAKGGRKAGESERSCLLRELREETGARKYKIHTKTPFTIEYKWPHLFIKDHKPYHGSIEHVYLVELFDEKIRLDKLEHDNYQWVGKKDFLKMLTYKNRRDIAKSVLKEYDKIIF